MGDFLENAPQLWIDFFQRCKVEFQESRQKAECRGAAISCEYGRYLAVGRGVRELEVDFLGVFIERLRPRGFRLEFRDPSVRPFSMCQWSPRSSSRVRPASIRSLMSAISLSASCHSLRSSTRASTVGVKLRTHCLRVGYHSNSNKEVGGSSTRVGSDSFLANSKIWAFSRDSCWRSTRSRPTSAAVASFKFPAAPHCALRSQVAGSLRSCSAQRSCVRNRHPEARGPCGRARRSPLRACRSARDPSAAGRPKGRVEAEMPGSHAVVAGALASACKTEAEHSVARRCQNCLAWDAGQAGCPAPKVFGKPSRIPQRPSSRAVQRLPESAHCG